MKTTCLFLTVLFFVSNLLLPNVSVPDYTEWSLPEDAKFRLGKGTIKKITLSPDGTLLAVASSIGVWIYGVHTGEELVLLTGHTGDVTSVAFSSDGSTLASGSADSTVRLWEVSTGTHLKTLKGHAGGVTSVCFSPDGHTLASASRDETIRLWRVAYGTHLKTLTGHKQEYFRPYSFSVAFSSDGKTLASSRGKEIYLWDAVSGVRRKTLPGRTEVVNDIAFSGDGKTLACAGKDSGINLWNVVSGEHLKALKGDTKPVISIAFSRDGNMLASASENQIHLWDAASGKHRKTLAAHTDPIVSVTFGRDGRTLASASEVKVCLWNATSGKHLKTLTGHTKSVYSVAFSGDGNTLASASGREIHLWDTTSGKRRKTLSGHTSLVANISFSSNGRTLACSSGNEIYLWDAFSGKHLKTLIGHTKLVFCVAFSADGNTLASGDGDGNIYLWDAASGEHLNTLTGDTHWVTSVAFSADGNILASRGIGGNIYLWDTASYEHQKTFKVRGGPYIASPSSGIRTSFAAADAYGKIHLWNASYKKRTFTTGDEDTKIYPMQVALNRNGEILATTDFNRIHLWDVNSGTQRKTLIGHIQEVTNVAFRGGYDTKLVSASKDGTALLWNVNLPRLLNPKLSKEAIAKQAMDSTVVVMANVITPEGKLESRFGSGFVVGSQSDGTMIATNYHVVKAFRDDGYLINCYVKLVNTDKQNNINEIVVVDKENDLAILKIDGFIGSLLFLDDSDEVEFGDSICAVGNPKGVEGTPSWGFVTKTPMDDSKGRFQIDAAISSGSSGGPLLNDRGNVIGIVVSGVGEGLDLNFAIPSNYLRKLLEKASEK